MLSQVEGLSKVLCSLGQFLGKLFGLVQSLGVRKVQRRLLGGHSQLLHERAQVVAVMEQAAVPCTLGLLAQSVHQSLAHHDHQLTLGDEFLRRLTVLEAAYEPTDGFLDGTEVEAAVLGQRRRLLFF